MTGRHRDWLDALALHSSGGRIDRARTLERGSAPGDERFSRATALHLALVGAASLSLGLWKAPPVLAQTREGCFTQCFTDHEKELQRRLQSCDDVFKGFKRTPPKTWARIKYLFPLGRVVVHHTLAALCYRDATDEVRGAKNDCYDRCETTCRRRSVQSSSRRSGATCEVKPPSKAPPPTIPPLPSPDDGVAAECANCASVGGVCCAGGDPTHLCACANATVPCEAYGCGT